MLLCWTSQNVVLWRYYGNLKLLNHIFKNMKLILKRALLMFYVNNKRNITLIKKHLQLICLIYLKGWNCGISHNFSKWNSSEAATGKKPFQFFQVLFLHLEIRRDPSFKAPLIKTIKHIVAIGLVFSNHVQIFKKLLW